MPPSVKDRACQDDEVARHLPLVRKIARTIFAQRSFDGVPFEEYVQFGAEGLLQALERYDPERGAQFDTYATHRIRGAILSGLEKSTEVNQQVATLRRLAQERMESLCAGDEEAASSVSGPQEAFGRLVNVALGLAVAFMLEDTRLYADSEPTHWDDGAANVAYKQLRHRLRQAMDSLNEQEKAVLERHYFGQESFVTIAAHLSLTKGRISQVHRAALLKLRDSIKQYRLDDLSG